MTSEIQLTFKFVSIKVGNYMLNPSRNKGQLVCLENALIIYRLDSIRNNMVIFSIQIFWRCI